MPGVSKEQIAQAKEIDLFSYLQACDPQELVRSGPNEYRTATHDSLKISNGFWHWTSRGIGGKTALDYLTKVQGISFVEAVETLCEGRAASLSFQPVQQNPKPPKPFELPPAHTNNNMVAAYLAGRGIDPAVTARCIHMGLLYENQKYHSCIFVGRDTAGAPRFACARGTGSDYKGDISGSNKKYGFVLPAERTSDIVIVHEAPIDALSTATINRQKGGEKWKARHYLSLSGTAPLALLQYLKDHPEIRAVMLRLDNDPAGRAGAEHIKTLLEPKGYTVTDNPPVLAKDCNAELQFLQKRQHRSRPPKQAAAITR